MLKVAVIGIGEQSWDNILPSLAQIESIVTVAVCDIIKSKADLAAIKYGANVYYDYEKMLQEEPIDALIIASYPEVHYKAALIALKKGIPTFIEKPPTLTISELQTLIKTNTHNVPTGVGLNFNYAEAIQIIDDLCTKESFGSIKYISINHYGNKPKTPFWNLTSIVKSFLLAQAIHPIGFITKYANRIVSCDIKKYFDNNNILINGNLLLKNNIGQEIIATLTTTNMAPHFMWRAEFITDKSIVVRLNSLWDLEIFDSNKNTHLIDKTKRWKDVFTPSPLSNGYGRTGYINQFNSFFNCIINKTHYSASLQSLLPVYKIMDIIEEKFSESITINNYQENQSPYLKH